MKISVCVPFYPWYREWDRSEEIFSVMIPSMIRAGYENFELSIVDAGVIDIWSMSRKWDVVGFRTRIRKEWPGDMVYTATDRAITPPYHSHPLRFWVSAAVEMSVQQSNHDCLWLNNIDIEIPVNFSQEYHKRVKQGTPWFPKCYNIRNDMPRVHENGGWRQGTGLVGIRREDYEFVGGQDENYIKDRHDSDLFNRCKNTFSLCNSGDRELLDGMFHIDHPGTCERTSAFNERGWK